VDDGLKQRLIGAIVLLALAVLFVPSLFNQEGRQRVDLSSQIPAEPLDSPAPLKIEELERPLDAAEMRTPDEFYPHSVEAAAVSDPVAEKAETIAASVVEAQTAANIETKATVETKATADFSDAVSIQVGSFESKERADALAKQLLQDDYKAYVRSSKSGNGTLHRVFVGPKLNREDAEREKAQLEKTLKIKALVVKFTP
jgi:DedD protein